MQAIIQLVLEEHWREAIEVLRELRPELDSIKTVHNRETLQARGYRLYGLFENSRIVCVAGVVLQPHITRGIDFWVHDLVTAEGARSRGYGEQMMRFLEDEARGLGCGRMTVHTRANRERAQNFYENHLGYERYAVVFQTPLASK